MAPLRPLPYTEVRRKLHAAGFREVSQRGSHVKFSKSERLGTLITVVPRHREVITGTLRSIIRQAELTVDAFVELLG